MSQGGVMRSEVWSDSTQEFVCKLSVICSQDPSEDHRENSDFLCLLDGEAKSQRG